MQIVNIHECLRVLPGLIEPAGANDLRAQVVVPGGKELDIAPQSLGGVKLEAADRVLDAVVDGGVLRGNDGESRAEGDEHDGDADEQCAQTLVSPDFFVQDRPSALRAAACALRQFRVAFAALHMLPPLAMVAPFQQKTGATLIIADSGAQCKPPGWKSSGNLSGTR